MKSWALLSKNLLKVSELHRIFTICLRPLKKICPNFDNSPKISLHLIKGWFDQRSPFLNLATGKGTFAWFYTCPLQDPFSSTATTRRVPVINSPKKTAVWALKKFEGHDRTSHKIRISVIIYFTTLKWCIYY